MSSSILLSLTALIALYRLIFTDHLPRINLSNVLLMRPLVVYGVDTRFLYPFGPCSPLKTLSKPAEDVFDLNANPYLNGLWSFYKDKWSVAEEDFEQAIQNGRSASLAAYALGVVRLINGNFEAAYLAWRSGGATTRLRFLGRWCARLGETQTAERYYKAALHSTSKDDIDAYRELVLFFSATVDQEAFERSLEGFLALTRPGTLDYNQTLGRVLLFRGQIEEARSLLKQAIEQAPWDGTNWYWSGVAAYKMGNYPQAKDEFLRAIALLPENVPSYLRLAETCLALQDRECAEKAYRDALRLDPNNSTAMEELNDLER